MILQGDCLELMKEIPDGAVDMVLTDLPYGITHCAFDKRIDTKKLFREIAHVTKLNAAILLFAQMNSCKVGSLPFAAQLIADSCIPYRYEWILQKTRPAGFLNAKKMPLRCHENLLVFYRKLPTYNPQFTKGKPFNKRQESWTAKNYRHCDWQGGINNTGDRCPRDCISFKNGDNAKTFHPQQKPVDLLAYLIKTYTNEGETVLDATMGSGSKGVVAINTGRKFIGFELEEKFYKIAAERIEAAIAQKAQSLF